MIFENSNITCETRIGCLTHSELWFSFMLVLIFREKLQLQLFDWTVGTHCATEASFSTKGLRHVAPTTLGTCLDSHHAGNKIGSRYWSTLVSTILRKSVRFFIVKVLLIKKLSNLKSGKWIGLMLHLSLNDSKTQERGLAKHFPGGAYPRTP